MQLIIKVYTAWIIRIKKYIKKCINGGRQVLGGHDILQVQNERRRKQ
jgi:hypothetical protein